MWSPPAAHSPFSKEGCHMLSPFESTQKIQRCRNGATMRNQDVTLDDWPNIWPGSGWHPNGSSALGTHAGPPQEAGEAGGEGAARRAANQRQFYPIFKWLVDSVGRCWKLLSENMAVWGCSRITVASVLWPCGHDMQWLGWWVGWSGVDVMFTDC